MTRMSRAWAMPSRHTFEVPPIGEFVGRWMRGVSVDPFAGHDPRTTYHNDLGHGGKDAVEWLNDLAAQGVKCDTFIFDPPYSPRQITECYASVGRAATMQDTQSSFWTRVRSSARPLLNDGAILLSFGWNSVGFGETIEEILIVCHGGAHNDTICMAETFTLGHEQGKLL